MIKCEFCNKKYNSKRDRDSLRNLNKHIKHCLLNPNKVNYKCKYCEYEDDNYYRLGSHVIDCISNPKYYEIKLSKIENGKISRPHSQETKDKLSHIRKKYLLENPDKVPYLLNHSSKESYPEKYFTELFEKENINVVKHYRIGLYQLDFCILDKKIDIEIDGNQHYTDPKIVESDIKRTYYLESNGWDVIRINWSEYSKMSFDDRSIYIDNIKRYINNLLLIKPTLDITENIKIKKLIKITNKKTSNKSTIITNPKNRKNKKCIVCNDETSSTRCLKCYLLGRRVVERPPYDILIKEIKETNLSAVGRKYGVSGNAIKKWVKNYESEKKDVESDINI